VATRLSVRTTAACRLFPSGEALPSTTSAGSCLPLFGRFHGFGREEGLVNTTKSGSHSAKTYSTVALRWSLSSGVLTSLALAAALGPDVIARYCLPLTVASAVFCAFDRVEALADNARSTHSAAPDSALCRRDRPGPDGISVGAGFRGLDRNRAAPGFNRGQAEARIPIHVRVVASPLLAELPA
jgi:hypothetical protein